MLGSCMMVTIATFIGQVQASLNFSSLPSDCPSTGAFMPTPTYGTKNGIFTICTSVTIAAPATRVYQILVDFEKYPEWNTFVLYVNKTSSGPYRIGTKMILTTTGLFPFGANSTSSEIISGIYPAAGQTTVLWKYDGPAPGLIDGEHVSRIVDLKGGKSRYLSYESYYGLGSALIQAFEGQALDKQFKVQGQDLKRRAESSAPF